MDYKESKKWYNSKTVWFNVVMTAIGVTTVAATMAKTLAPDAAIAIDAVAVGVAGIGNVILRVWFTDMPIQ